ncbi:MAG TPA: EVE domain-containing protein [Verrucomicrobiae bacterium]|nr:EVE domain-containing protein [Verrucomicrobiae bacterium]
MACWLIKEEPTHYSFDDLARDGGTVWAGVTNALALIHIRKMKKGDEAFYYHTGGEKAVVGLATIASDPYPDPDAGDPKRVVVRVKPVARLPRNVSLAEMKANPNLAGFDLLRISRLSVVPVGEAHRREILRMSRARARP